MEADYALHIVILHPHADTEKKFSLLPKIALTINTSTDVLPQPQEGVVDTRRFLSRVAF
jgi:hypothetical protein